MLTSRFSQNLLVALLLSLFAVQAITSLSQKSTTVDEIAYITAGLYHLRTGDFHYNATNPPLMKMISALPLLLLGPQLPSMDTDRESWSDVETWQYARRFFFENETDADLMLFAARIPSVLLGVAVGLGVFLWSRSLYGPKGGLLSLLLFSFSPNLLAHTRLATQDIGLTAAFLLATFAFYRYTECPRPAMLLLTGLVLGFGLAIKTTMAFIVPILGLYAAFRLARSETWAVDMYLPGISRIRSSRLRQFASLSSAAVVLGFLSLFALDLSYGFQGVFQPLGSLMDPDRLEHRLTRLGAARPLGELAVAAPSPLPSALLESMRYQRSLGGASGNVFFAGRHYEHGAWWILPATFLVKTPIPLILLIVAAVGFLLVKRARSPVEWISIAFVGVFFGAFAYLSGVGSNLRYALPILPMIMVLAGRLIPDVRGTRWAEFAIAGLCAWYIGSSMLIYPHYLAYANELIGGPTQAYRYVAESNLDWGQDLKGLKHYMDKRGLDRIRLGYFGSADATYYGIDYDYLPSVGLPPRNENERWWYELREENSGPLQLEPGLVAVSANLISAPQWIGHLFRDRYAPFREIEPVDSVGYSILIFEIR